MMATLTQEQQKTFQKLKPVALQQINTARSVIGLSKIHNFPEGNLAKPMESPMVKALGIDGVLVNLNSFCLRGNGRKARRIAQAWKTEYNPKTPEYVPLPEELNEFHRLWLEIELIETE